MSYETFDSTVQSGVGWLGDIPSHWEVVPAKALFSLRTEKALPNDVHLTPSQKYGVLPQVEYMEITGNRVVLNLMDSGQMKHVEPNDFVSHLRSFQGGLELSRIRGKVSGAYTVLTPRKDQNPEFWKYALKSDTYIQALQTTTDQLRDGQSIRLKEFAQIPLPLVPRPEQDAIAHYLNVETSRIDNLITIQNSFRTLLAERDHSTRQQLIESAWPLVRFGRVVKQVLGNGEAETGVSLDAIESWTGHVFSENLQTNVSGTLFRANDVLFGRLRPYLAKSFVPEFEGAALGDVLVFRSDLVEASFLSLLMRTRSFIEHCTGASYGTKMPRVNWDIIREFEFPLPPREVQIQIVEKVSLELARSELLRSKSLLLSDLLTNRKTCLIANVVTGKFELQGETDG